MYNIFQITKGASGKTTAHDGASFMLWSECERNY